MMISKLKAFLLIATSWSISVSAQKDYALSSKGDTLRGKIKLYSFDNIDRVQIITADGKKTSQTALQVREFVKDEIHYQAMKLDNSIRFMKVIKSGYLSLFAFSATNSNSWDGQYLAKKDGTGMEVPNLGFKKLLAKYLSDCPEVNDKIEHGDLPKKDIAKIVDLYNICIQTITDGLAKSKTPVSATTFSSEKLLALQKFSEKLEGENFLTKKDVIDLLKDMQGKVSKNEPIPNYLAEGLKSYLTDTPALQKEADELIALLKK